MHQIPDKTQTYGWILSVIVSTLTFEQWKSCSNLITLFEKIYGDYTMGKSLKNYHILHLHTLKVVSPSDQIGMEIETMFDDIKRDNLVKSLPKKR